MNSSEKNYHFKNDVLKPVCWKQ